MTLFVNLWLRHDGVPADPSAHTSHENALDEIIAGYPNLAYDGTVVIEGMASKVEDWSRRAEGQAREQARDYRDSQRIQRLTHAEMGIR